MIPEIYETPETVAWRCSVTQVIEACNFVKKETSAQVFSCQFCEIFKSTYFAGHLMK